MYKKIIPFILLLVLIFISGCDKGIEPGEPLGPAGFSGKVTFIGTWPEGIKRTHLVVFKSPIKASEDFFPPNLTFIVDSIPYRSSEFSYNSFDNNFVPIFQIGAGSYNYVVVAQSSTPDISLDRKDWVVVGVYCLNGDQTNPAVLSISASKVAENINIVVDFNNPPPQPPE